MNVLINIIIKKSIKYKLEYFIWSYLLSSGIPWQLLLLLRLWFYIDLQIIFLFFRKISNFFFLLFFFFILNFYLIKRKLKYMTKYTTKIIKSHLVLVRYYQIFQIGRNYSWFYIKKDNVRFLTFGNPSD